MTSQSFSSGVPTRVGAGLPIWGNSDIWREGRRWGIAKLRATPFTALAPQVCQSLWNTLKKAHQHRLWGKSQFPMMLVKVTQRQVWRVGGSKLPFKYPGDCKERKGQGTGRWLRGQGAREPTRWVCMGTWEPHQVHSTPPISAKQGKGSLAAVSA